MSIKLRTPSNGSVTLSPQDTASDVVLTVPAVTATLNTSGAVNEVPAGSASAPSIYPTGDTNTGIFFPAADVIAAATGGSERWRTDSSGNLLVGTTTQVQGTGATFSTASRGSSAFLNVQAADATNCDAALYLECPGLIGSTIWTSRSSAQLRIATGITATGVSLASGGTSWGSFSDERMKDIIEPITEAAQKVSSLRAVIGKYKTDDEGKRRAFLIAQDVKAVLPEAVYQNSEEDDTLSLVYTDMIPLLTAAIQEQQAMIQTLQAEVADLKSKVQA